MNSATAESPARRGPLAGVLKNVTSNWAALLVNTALSFVVAPIVVKNLGSVYYGIWALVMQFTGYIWLFDFGVRESVIKYVAQYQASGDRHELATTVRTAIAVYSVVSGVGLAAVGGLALALPLIFNVPPEAAGIAQVTAFVTGATVALSFLANVFVGVLMGLQRFYLMSRLGMITSLCRAGATILLVQNGYGVIGLAVLQLVLSVVSGGIAYRLCLKHLPGIPFRPVWPRRPDVLKLLRYGKWVLVANIGDKIVFATDALVVGMFMTVAVLTPYAIAGTLIGHLRSFVTAMAAIFNPLTSSVQAEKGNASVAAVLQGGTRAAVVLGLPVCIGFVVLGERFISLWMGEEYGATAGFILTLLAIGQIVGLPYQTISGVLYGLGEHRPVALLRVIEGAANLALSVTLIQIYGLPGVALGTAIPHVIVVGGVLPLILPKLLPLSLRQYYVWVYVRPFLASIPFGAATWLIATSIRPDTLVSFVAWGAASLVTYAIPVWFLAFSATERSHMAGAARRRLGRVAYLRAA
jgi:O-antigen/teichoic acid export membrane protein